MNKSELLDGYGLSCIENFFLYQLKSSYVGWTNVFYKSYLSFYRIFIDFYIHKKEYAYYDGIPRIHHTAEDLNLCTIIYSDQDKIDDIFQKTSLAAICVTPESIYKKYKTKLLRDDHYIFIKKSEQDVFHYLNDFPRDEGEVTMEILKKMFCKKSIWFMFNTSNIANIDVRELSSVFYDSVLNCECGNIEEILVDEADIDIDVARDALGVLRVIIRRTAAFCEKDIEVCFLKEYFQIIDQCFTSIEYKRIRKRYDQNEIKELMKNIAKKDKVVREELIKRMGDIYGGDRR